MLKKIATWLGIAFTVFFIISRPAAAASVVKGIGAGLLAAGEGFGNFFSNLVS